MTRMTTPLRSSLLACLALLAAMPATAEKVKTLAVVDKAIAHSGGDLYSRSSRGRASSA
jgi:hypothetical protein